HSLLDLFALSLFSSSILCMFVIFSLSLHDALPILQGFTDICSYIDLFLMAAQPMHIMIKSIYNSVQPFQCHRRDQFTLIKQLFRSEEHTSELQSRFDHVCRLLLEIKM